MGSSYTPPVNLAAPGPIGGTTPAAITGTTLAATTSLSVPLGGSTSATKIFFAGHSDTGIFSAAGANIELVANGVASLRVEPNYLITGNVPFFAGQNGTAAVPAWNFINQTGSGVFLNTTGSTWTGIASAGVEAMAFAATLVTSRVDFSVPTKTPASAAATGVTGTIAWDASFIYIATATDTWKRAAIATW